MSMKGFKVLSCLGRGAFASVYLAEKLPDGTKVVIKKLHKGMSSLCEKERTEAANEVKVQSGLRHINIVRFHYSFVEDDTMHIVMEYASGGTLNKVIANRGGEYFEEDTIWEWLVQILAALKYVHQRRLMHRDLKTQNIMLGGAMEDVVKLGDFGIAKVLGTADAMGTSVVGTPYCLSPELCMGKPYDQKSDVWALGCVLYELCCLHKPFDASNLPAIFLAIMKNDPRPLPDVYSQELRDLCPLLMDSNPETRPTVRAVWELDVVQMHNQRWEAKKASRASRASPFFDTATSMATPLREMSPPASTRHLAPAVEEGTGAPFNEADVLDQLASLTDQADTEADDEKAALHDRLKALHDDLLLRPPGVVSGSCWEAVGRAWAESGDFLSAIKAFRLALRSANSTASVGAMEQLGNLLVRHARSLWQLAKDGTKDDSMSRAMKRKDFKMVLLGRSASSLMGHQRSKSRRLTTLISSASQAKDGQSDQTKDEYGVLAYSMMTEGLGLLERLCALGETAERRCLLGSAYKRQAWMGLGESRKTDLQNAAQAYGAAHRLELEKSESTASVVAPSPYARLNQLTFELLAGTAADADRLRGLVKQAEEWAVARREQHPEDVWLWVQAVDAQYLRWLLNDPDVSEASVLSLYQTQFAFGASQRVKSSVLDQLSFMKTVLQGRLEEETEASPAGPWLSTVLGKVEHLRSNLSSRAVASVRGTEAKVSPTHKAVTAFPKSPPKPSPTRADIPHGTSGGAGAAAALVPFVPLSAAAPGKDPPKQPAPAKPVASKPPKLPSPTAVGSRSRSSVSSEVSENPFARRSSNPYRSRSSSSATSELPPAVPRARRPPGANLPNGCASSSTVPTQVQFPTLTSERLRAAGGRHPPAVAVVHEEGADALRRPSGVHRSSQAAVSRPPPQATMRPAALEPLPLAKDKRSLLQIVTCCFSVRLECYCCTCLRGSTPPAATTE